MELYILRHAIAEPKDATNAREDSQRELTPEGKRKNAPHGWRHEGPEPGL